MPDEITLKSIQLLRDCDPNLDEIASMDKFIAHQTELSKMRDQYVSYSNHPQAEKMKKRLEVLEESSQAFTWVYFMMLQYKREKLLAQASELEMANAVIELKHELDLLIKLNDDD